MSGCYLKPRRLRFHRWVWLIIRLSILDGPILKIFALKRCNSSFLTSMVCLLGSSPKFRFSKPERTKFSTYPGTTVFNISLTYVYDITLVKFTLVGNIWEVLLSLVHVWEAIEQVAD